MKQVKEDVMFGRRFSFIWGAIGLVMMLLLAACADEESVRGYQGSPENGINNYPVSYKGSATVDFPQDMGTATTSCPSDGNFDLFIDSKKNTNLVDELKSDTCFLTVSAEWWFLDTEAKCTTNGDIEAWVIKGTSNPQEQVCIFTSCNDGLYQAQGSLAFGVTGSEAGKITCKDPEKGDIEVTVKIHTGTPVK